MRTAAAAAMSEGFQYYLLLNDDTHLHAGALATLLETSRGLSARGREGAIVVGSTEAPDRSGLSYGGWRWGKRFFALRFEKVPPSSEPVLCDTFNGNCTLIPDATLRALGNLDPVFTHAMGDHDFGLRARRAGIATYIAPGYVGTCEKNEGRGAWLNPSLPPLERWRRFLGPKGLPLREWLAFTSRHTGALWPLYFVNPYVKFWIRTALPRLGGRGHARAAGPK
jgi:GT2 family glycosyltransferase